MRALEMQFKNEIDAMFARHEEERAQTIELERRLEDRLHKEMEGVASEFVSVVDVLESVVSDETQTQAGAGSGTSAAMPTRTAGASSSLNRTKEETWVEHYSANHRRPYWVKGATSTWTKPPDI
eukprot:SAG31_NODE_3163_length_4605_cov_15.046383_3_plen_124_part_00